MSSLQCTHRRNSTHDTDSTRICIPAKGIHMSLKNSYSIGLIVWLVSACLDSSGVHQGYPLPPVLTEITMNTAIFWNGRLSSLVAAYRRFGEIRGAESELYYDRRSVGQSVLEQSTHLGLTTRFLLLSDHCGFLIWGVLSDERTGLSFTMYNVQYTIYFTVSDLTRFLYLYPPGTGWPRYTPRHWVTRGW
jgi:hypothetical protein